MKKDVLVKAQVFFLLSLLFLVTACSSEQADEVFARLGGKDPAQAVSNTLLISDNQRVLDIPAACAGQIPPSGAPVYSNQKMNQRAVFVCRSGFSAFHSGVTRTPLWVAELLTPDRVLAARSISRDDLFHPEPSLPVADRAELPDYVRSGYDRGHLAPSADMPTAESQAESFSLANIAPQVPSLNRGAWAQLETLVRQRALSSPVFVITGVGFRGSSIGFLKGRVGVPTEFFKLVYDPLSREATVFVASNLGNSSVKSVDVPAFESSFGISFHLNAVSPLTLGESNVRNARRRK